MAKGKSKVEKTKAEKHSEKELSKLTLSQDDVLAQLREALQVEDFQPQIELIPREGKVVYDIDASKVADFMETIKSVQDAKLKKNPTWKGVPITVKQMCALFGVDWEYDAKKKNPIGEDGVVTYTPVVNQRKSLPPVVEDKIEDVQDSEGGSIVLEMIKSGGIKDAESGKTLPAYWVRYTPADESDATLEEEEEGATTAPTEGAVEELSMD